MSSRIQTSAMRKVLSEHSRCELCGSSRNIEAHHIIPISLGGADCVENILAVCEKCHVLLTPKSMLTKKGIDNIQVNNFAIMVKNAVYDKIIQEEEEYGSALSFSDVLDVFDGVIETVQGTISQRKGARHA